MESPQQIQLVKDLHRLSTKIRKSKDQEEISLLGMEAIKLATPVPPFIIPWMKNTNYTQQSKDRAIESIKMDLNTIEAKTEEDWEFVHVNLSISIAQLALTFVDGGISRASEIIDKE
jgi:hypothetical protein